MRERGATEEEVEAAIRDGERIPAKFGRAGFRRNFRFDGSWRAQLRNKADRSDCNL
ncbi:MAG: hypothetical protein AB7H90_19040 [Alphaproteobacteria bacterium]